jgi:hypothetical protein
VLWFPYGIDILHTFLVFWSVLKEDAYLHIFLIAVRLDWKVVLHE